MWPHDTVCTSSHNFIYGFSKSFCFVILRVEAPFWDIPGITPYYKVDNSHLPTECSFNSTNVKLGMINTSSKSNFFFHISFVFF